MIVAYADSSFLVSAFGNDANSVLAGESLRKCKQPLVFTPLHALEFDNAFALMIWRKSCTPLQARAAKRQLQAQIRGGRLVPTETDWANCLRTARHFAQTRTKLLGTRSLDILDVAAARLCKAKTFYSFDHRQRALAERKGLTVLPALP